MFSREVNIPITTKPLIAIVISSNELKKTQNIIREQCLNIFKVGHVDYFFLTR